MTPERGYELAKHQRSGVRIVMGPTEAIEKPMEPMNPVELYKMDGFASWSDYDLHKRLGFLPSCFARSFAIEASILGHKASDDEWVWLSRTATLAQANSWLKVIRQRTEKEDQDSASLAENHVHLKARIEELEAKLAKAVGFIEDFVGCEWPYGDQAERAIAELKGDTNE